MHTPKQLERGTRPFRGGKALPEKDLGAAGTGPEESKLISMSTIASTTLSVRLGQGDVPQKLEQSNPWKIGATEATTMCTSSLQ